VYSVTYRTDRSQINWIPGVQLSYQHELAYVRNSVSVVYSRDGPIRKFHYSAEAEYLLNATEAEAEASAEYFLPFFTY
jgi:hypothetical protein